MFPIEYFDCKSTTRQHTYTWRKINQNFNLNHFITTFGKLIL